MRILFFPHEQYLPFEYEAGNFEIRLPVLNCGLISETETFVYQRVLRSHGREEMNKRAWNIAKKFQPDAVIHYRTWPFPVDENLDHSLIHTIDKEIAPVLSVAFDSYTTIHQFEMEALVAPSYFAMLTSIHDFIRFKRLEKIINYETKVTSLIGHNVLTELFKPINYEEKIYDVSFLGSIYGHREEWLNNLQRELNKKNIKLFVAGGNFNTKLDHQLGFRGVDWLPYNEYVDVIRKSKICLNLPSIADHISQIKGRLFEIISCNTLCFNMKDVSNEGFLPDEGIVYYNNFEDCLKKIIYYLDNDSKIKKEALSGHNWYLEKFDYKLFWCNLLESMVSRSKVTLPQPFEYVINKYLENEDLKDLTKLSNEIKIKI